MRKFIFSVLCVSVFFIGLGAIVDRVGAKFKSDEKALALIAQARQAIGGDQALAAVRSMTITGKATKTFDMNGESRSEQGDVEINMQMPDKFSKILKIGKHDGTDGSEIFEKKIDVVMVTKDGENGKMTVNADGTGDGVRQVITVRKADGDATVEGLDAAKGDVVFVRKAGDGGTWKTENDNVRKVVIKSDAGEGKAIGEGHSEGAGHSENEMLRTAFALLMTAPVGIDAGYTYIGEEGVDGMPCDVINVEATGSAFRVYLDQSSHLPRMISYQDAKPMILAFRTNDKPGAGVPASGEIRTFNRKLDAPEMAQYQVRFSDYRSVSGVQLPYRWAQSVGGKDDETIDITGYEINPANIGEKFQEQRVFVRTQKQQ